MNEPVDFIWLKDPDFVDEIVRLFIHNLETSYISHSEILIGRSEDVNKWSDNLEELLESEIRNIFSEADASQRLAVAMSNGSIDGVCIIQQIQTRKNRIWVIEDIIIKKQARSAGIGSRFLEWIQSEAKELKVNYMLCESGISNEPAHHFFEKNGFNTLSLTFIKKL